ncbi:tRNA lysidine(34) synthetase TilS [Kaarinaea lacus]
MAITTPHSKVVQSVLTCLKQAADIKRYWIAYSGGIDSHVLVHVLATHQHHFGDVRFSAVHINHALNPQADQWAEHCRKVCDELQIPYIDIDVDATPGPGESPEARAREARYQAIIRLIREGDCLLTAHHQDDQVETLLLQLMRGSGPKGLAAMPQRTKFGTGYLARPLLGVRREDLHAYALANQLKWINDESNLDTKFDRNFIRHEIVPRLAQRWPSLSQTISRSARYCAEAVELLDDAAEHYLREINPDELPYLSVSKLVELTKAQQRNVIRHWINQHDMNTPSSTQLEQVIEQVLSAAPDSMPKVSWEGCEIRRYRDHLYVLPTLQPFNVGQVIPWDVTKPVFIEGIGELSAISSVGSGIAKKYISSDSVSIHFRQGGETIQPAGKDQHHALKKLFQEQGVAPWIRERMPLIYINDQLAAVGEMFISEDFQAVAGEDGYIFQWESGFVAKTAQVTDL